MLWGPVLRFWCRWWSPDLPARLPPIRRGTPLPWCRLAPWPAGRLRIIRAGHHQPTQPVIVSPGCVCRAGWAERAPDERTQGFRGRRGSIYDLCMRCLTLQGGERCGIDDFPLYAPPRPVKTLNYPIPDPLPSPHTQNY